MSLGACSGGTIGLLLRKMGKTVRAIKVEVKGTRRDQHPTSFQEINLDFTVSSNDVSEYVREHKLQIEQHLAKADK